MIKVKESLKDYAKCVQYGTLGCSTKEYKYTFDNFRWKTVKENYFVANFLPLFANLF